MMNDAYLFEKTEISDHPSKGQPRIKQRAGHRCHNPVCSTGLPH